MHWWASIAGIVLIFVILMDAFETVVLPRRIKRHFRIASLFYKNTWGFWTEWAAYQVGEPARRVSRVLWAAVADRADGLLGAWPDSWIRLRTVRTGRTPDAGSMKGSRLEK
jgi:hypothetical protein